MNKPVVRLCPLLVVRRETFKTYGEQLLRLIGVSSEARWWQACEEVRLALERINPSRLARFMHHRPAKEVMEIAYVFAVMSLGVGFCISPGFRRFIRQELALSRSYEMMREYPFGREQEVSTEIVKLLELLHQPVALPQVVVDLTHMSADHPLDPSS